MTKNIRRTITEHGTLDLTGLRVEAGEEYRIEVDVTSRGRGYGKSISCTCTEETGCPEVDNPCLPCALLDIYEPCPVLGFGDGEEIDR